MFTFLRNASWESRLLNRFRTWQCVSSYNKNQNDYWKKQCCGSGNNDKQKQKKDKKISFLNCSMFSSEGFSLDVLYGGLGITNCNFWWKKIIFFKAALFCNFWSSAHWIRIRKRNHLKCWIRVRIQWIRIHYTGEKQTKIITNVPVFIWHLDLMILMWENPLLGPVEEVGPENLDFFGPKWHLLRSLPLMAAPKSSFNYCPSKCALV
jgi:hypothetical protein